MPFFMPFRRSRGLDPAAEGHLPADGPSLTSRLTTALAAVVVVLALVAPNDITRLTAAVFVRLPVEGLIVAALILVLPPWPRRVVSALFGVVLGLMTIMKVLDMAFLTTLERPFDPVFDWSFVSAGMDFLTGEAGRVGAYAAMAGVVVLAAVIVAVLTVSVMRVSRVAVDHRSAATHTVRALWVVWIICAVLGVEIVPGEPIAAQTTAALAYDDLRQVSTDLRDRQPFEQEVATDAYRGTPGPLLLNGLRGKDVMFTFVESYGRDVVQGSDLAQKVDAVLDDGTNQLRAAGFGSRSAFLTSSTTGGGSWLAHSTLQSGLKIDNQQRYNDLLASDRFTLGGAFKRAGWKTVWDVPAHTQDWPEGKKFYGPVAYYDARNVGYHGPGFAYATMPDQYTLANFQRAERAQPGHQPVMAELDLVSSHAPWTPRPWLVDWDSVGDGSVFNPMPAAGDQPGDIWSDHAKVRLAYRDAIAYSLSTLISYVQKYGDDNLVLVFLGDHQPPVVTPANASHDVPITIVAKDPKVLDRISGWGWSDGLRPTTQAPTWPMESFRDRFLKAFG